MYFPFFATAVVFLVFLIQWLLKRREKNKHLDNIPGAPKSFPFGNIGWVIRMYAQKSEFHPAVHILYGILGQNLLYNTGIFRFWVGPFTPVVVCSSAETVELILTSNTSLEKSYEYRFLHKWLGTGLLTSSGSKWRTRRKLLTPSFHFKILEDFLPIFDEQSLVLVNKLKSLSNEEFVSIEPLIVLCTLDIVCETVMGVSIGAQKGKNSDYVQAVHNLGEFFNMRTVRPWLWFDALFRLTSIGRAFDKDLNTLHSFTQKVIKEKKKILQESATKINNDERGNTNEFETKKRQALMDLLLNMHLNSQELTEEDIQEEVDTFMFEGHDTTAMGVLFSLYCIGLYPHVQSKIVKEIDSIFEDDSERATSFDDVRNMKYLECTIKEAQRLFPSVPIIGRIMNEDTHYKGMTIPKGTSVHCNILTLHRRRDAFPKPEVFDPDRFLPENIVNRHPYAYIPFSAGPRNCIGQKFALLEEKVIISNVLRHFNIISLDPRDRVHTVMEFTLKPAQPIRLKFTPRK